MIRLRGPSFMIAAVWALLAGAGSALAGGPPCPSCADPHPEDTFICGCLPADSGVIGASEASGNVLESISVPVVARTMNTIDAFGFELWFPTDLLRYDSTEVGKATEHFDFFAGQLQSGEDIVRVGGAEAGGDTVPTGATATLALIHFTVLAPGCNAFSFVTLQDDLALYTACDFPAAVSVPDPAIASPELPGLSAWPNPFAASVAIDFTLPSASTVRIDVYDPAGRRVVSLAERGVASSRGRHVWHGLDQSGKPVPAGVYFVRLQTESSSRNLKVLRVR